MALQEGRCPNCGSILFLDNKQEKSHCLYCDAVFDTGFSLELSKAPEDHSFENLPQPKYEGPNLDPAEMRSRVDFSKMETQNKTQRVTQNEAVFVPSGGKVPSLDLSLKTKLTAIAFFLSIALLFLALMLPFTIRRDRNRKAIAAELGTKITYEAEIGEDFSINRFDNSSAFLVTKEKKSRQEAFDFFKAFCETRADVMKIDRKDAKKVYGRVSMTICSPDGGWVIQNPQELSAETAVRELKD